MSPSNETNGTNGTNGSNGTNGTTSVTVPLIIGGKEVFGPQTFTVTNPASGEVTWEAAGASVKEATQAVEAAAAAFPAWSRAKPAVRRDIFLRAAQLFDERYEEFKGYQAAETGADPMFMQWILKLTVDNMKELAGKCSMVQGIIPFSADEGRSALVLREPYGVVLGIAPWYVAFKVDEIHTDSDRNAPWPLGCRAVAFALAAGNTCVLKGSELSPRCFHAIVKLFGDAGLPDGVLNLVFHHPKEGAEITETLIAHPAVKKVNFTGSTGVGAIISAMAGKHLKPIITELGGKASTIVLKDADIKKAAAGCVMGAFLHAGQICMSTDRVVVHKSIIDEFTAAFKEATEQAYGEKGPTPTFVTAPMAQKTKKLVKSALDSGAKVILGEPQESLEIDEKSTRMKPIILTNVSKDSDFHKFESFGPSVALYTFETEKEALAIANDCDYGLTGSIFTKDLAAAFRLAKGYETGGVHINAMSIHDESNLPHGGAKKSGWGRFSAQAGLDEYLRYKTITYDDNP